MRLQIWQVPTLAALLAMPAMAGPLFFSTGDPDGKMAAATRPATAGKFEIEAGDDFVEHRTTFFPLLLSSDSHRGRLGSLFAEFLGVINLGANF